MKITVIQYLCLSIEVLNFKLTAYNLKTYSLAFLHIFENYAI